MSDEHQQPITPVPPASSSTQRRSSRMPWLIAAAAVVGVLVLAGIGYMVLRPRNAPVKHTATAAQQQTVAPTTSASNSLATYVSKGSDLNLSFSYPANWDATPASGGNTSDQPITVTSPVMPLTNAAGQTVNGKIVFMIRPGGSDITELDGNAASVAADSVQIAYTKPTPNQNIYPFITFVHLSAGNNSTGVFEEVVITGINKFTKGQALLAGSFGQVDPIISATFYQCSTQACTGSGMTPFSLTSNLWNNSSEGQQALAIFQSLQIN